jgi:hypothetical protein
MMAMVSAYGDGFGRDGVIRSADPVGGLLLSAGPDQFDREMPGQSLGELTRPSIAHTDLVTAATAPASST